MNPIPYLFDQDYEPKVKQSTFFDCEGLYGYTYKILKGKLQESSYNYILNNLRNHGTIHENVFERDSKGRLHIHGVFKPKTPRLQIRNVTHEKVHSNWEPLYDLEGWTRYINKENPIE